jgi:hypothetical protein
VFHTPIGDELPVVHDQVCEDVEALGPEGHGHAVPEQESSVEIEDERSESILAPTLFIRDGRWRDHRYFSCGWRHVADAPPGKSEGSTRAL